MNRTKVARSKDIPDLIVVLAFDKDDAGNLVPAFEPRQLRTRSAAIEQASTLSLIHQGVIAWSRTADLAVGEYGEPDELYRSGEVPELE